MRDNNYCLDMLGEYVGSLGDDECVIGYLNACLAYNMGYQIKVSIGFKEVERCYS